jgi:hypothetical protein
MLLYVESDLCVLLGGVPSSRTHCVDKHFVVERFAQIGDRPACECVLAHADVVVCGDEDDGHGPAGQTLLDFESIKPGHLHVKNDAVGLIGRYRCEDVEERVAARKRFRGDPGGYVNGNRGICSARYCLPFVE